MSLNLSASQWLPLHGIVTLAGVLLYVLTSHAMPQRRSPSAAIAWVFFILLIPYLALPIYLIFGSRKLPRLAPPDAHGDANTLRGNGWAMQTAAVLGQPAAVDYHHFHLHAGGREARVALFEIIEGARHSIDMCTFIFRRDEFGEAVLDRLCERARRGVRVRVMIDGLGSLMVRRPDMQRLVHAGGAWILFVPPIRALLNGRANLRDHRKLLVADAGRETARLLCGGRNIAATAQRAVPVEDNYRVIPVELTGYFRIPVTAGAFSVVMGGGVAAYFGDRHFVMAGVEAPTTTSTAGFGIHVLGGFAYRISEWFTASADIKFRDAQFQTTNAFAVPNVKYGDIFVSLPQGPFASTVHTDGMVVQIGIGFNF